MKTDDYVFEPKLSEATKVQIEKSIERVFDPAVAKHRANFHIVFDDGSVKEYLEQPCHSSVGLAYYRNEDNGQREAVVSGLGWNRVERRTKEEIRPFLDFVLRRHHLGRFILNRDDPSVVKAWVVSADIPAPWLQNLNILSRHFYEISTAGFRTFNDLVSNGTDPFLAYNVAMNSNIGQRWLRSGHEGDNPVTPDMSMVFSTYGGHRAHNCLDTSGLFKLRHGEVFTEALSGKTYRDDCNYYGGSDMYGNGSLVPTLMRSRTFMAALAEYRKGKVATEVYRPPNPFSPRPPAPRADQVSVGEMLSFVVGYVNNLLEEVDNADDVRDVSIAADRVAA